MRAWKSRVEDSKLRADRGADHRACTGRTGGIGLLLRRAGPGAVWSSEIYALGSTAAVAGHCHRRHCAIPCGIDAMTSSSSGSKSLSMCI